MARPEKFTEELAKRICDYIALGNHGSVAARACGIVESTFYRWLAQGRAGEEPFVKFASSVEKARAQAEARAVQVITEAIIKDKSLDAAKWFLERTAPERFGRRDKVQVDIAVERELSQALDKLERTLAPHEYERVLAALSAGEAGEDASGIKVEVLGD